MRQLAAAIILTGVFCSVVPAQSDSGLVLGVEWRRVIKTPVGASLVEQIQKSPFSQIPAFQSFQDAILHDVDSVTISIPSSGLNAGVEQPPVLLVVKGRFETAKLRGMLAKKGQTAERYSAVELLAPPDSSPKSKPGLTRIALLDSNTILVGDRTQVRAAIDRVRKGGSARPSMPEGAKELAASNDLWMVLNIPPDATKDAPPAMAQMLAGVNSAELGVSFGDGMAMEMNFRTNDDATAKTLAQAIQGMVSLAALSQDQSSQNSLETLKKIQITPEGSLVRMALAIDKEEFDKVVAERQSRRTPFMTAGRPTPEPSTPTAAPANPAAPAQPARTEPAAPKMIHISGLDSGPMEIPLGKPTK